jgi:hypothetical protein
MIPNTKKLSSGKSGYKIRRFSLPFYFLLLTLTFAFCLLPFHSPLAHAATIGVSPSAPSIATTSCSSGLSCGLVGYWTFDGKDTVWTSATAATTKDKSGSGNTGTLTNMNIATAPVAGKVGQGLRFDGSTNYVSVSNTISSRSVAFWIKSASSSASMINLTSGAYIAASSGTITATGFTSPTIYVNGASGSTLTANVWNHIVVTDTAATSSNAITFGKANSAYTNGIIDDVRIYNRALSASEVGQLYNMGR